MSESKLLDIEIAQGKDARLTPLLIVTIGGEQKTVEEVCVTKVRSKAAAAKRWAESFGIDEADALKKLDAIGMKVVANMQARQAGSESDAPRVRDLARDFIEHHVSPEYHEDGSRVYSRTLGRLIRVSEIWREATPEIVDAVGKTQDGRPTGNAPGAASYESRVRLLKLGIHQAMACICREIPNRSEVEVDGAVDRDELVQHLLRFMLRKRLFRSSTGTARDGTYAGWAGKLAIGEGWQQCGCDNVFGRRDDEDSPPQIAVVGAILVAELNYRSAKRLAADLRNCSLADPDFTFANHGITRRAWRLTFDYGQLCEQFTDSITPDSRDSEAHA